ncbi:MAG: calcium-binding protein, partial [Cyanobacteriota bacterium]
GIDELRFASTTANQILSVFAGDTGLEFVTIAGTLALHVNAAAAPNGLAISGNTGNNTLTGSIAADTLIGGLGNDTLTGGLGIDVFRFNNALNATTNVDRITDFSIADSDGIQLENNVFTALTTTGTLAPTAFLAAAAATTAAQRILYDTTNGNLFYDPDGTGATAATLFATLNTGLALTNDRFSVT